jgi:hypothetical protein
VKHDLAFLNQAWYSFCLFMDVFDGHDLTSLGVFLVLAGHASCGRSSEQWAF